MTEPKGSHHQRSETKRGDKERREISPTKQSEVQKWRVKNGSSPAECRTRRAEITSECEVITLTQVIKMIILKAIEKPLCVNSKSRLLL